MKPHVWALLGIVWAFPTVSFGQGAADEIGSRNPFDFVNNAPVGLNMVYVQDDNNLAVINGKEYRIGDKVGGAMVTSITIDYVELTSAKRKWKLHVN
jgi:hypothetical protein